jgi:ATP-dependent RNA helicase RhlE
MKDTAAMQTFSHLGLRPELLQAVKKLGLVTPTPIQLAAIPAVLEGRDLSASAPTGSGKTVAFALPIVQRLLEAPPSKGATVLILTPTRELAAQIAAVMTSIGHAKTVAVYGGVGFGAQAAAVRRGVNVIVATPGRLLDHLTQRTISLATISTLVLDEADRMLDMGFLPAVKRIVKYLPQERQTMLFSATIGPEISNIAREILNDPLRVAVQPPPQAAQRLQQTIYSIEQGRKTDLLIELLKDNSVFSALAFTRTKARANRLADALSKHKIPTERIHGNRSQSQRTRALSDFKAGKCRVLVATDIAARGLDISELDLVVNYDVPMVPDDYVHRVGRTARASASGDAVTFVSPEEESQISYIERALGKRIGRSKSPIEPTPRVEMARPRFEGRRRSPRGRG